ncbi:MAG: agmatinase family protein [Candidatus Bipolaricaulia bacterium]
MGERWMGLQHEDGVHERADVVIIGVPYDGSVSHDPGAAEAPAVLRELSISASAWTETGLSFADMRIRDVGDVPVGPKNDEAAQAAIRETISTLPSEDAVVVALGGDHSITSGVLAGLRRSDRLGVLWFDAHPDLMNTFGALRGKRESMWNHACPLRRILEFDNVSGEDVLLVGIRDFLPEELAYIRDQELDVIWARDQQALTARNVADRIEQAFENVDSLYISFDIDVLDPSAAPGTGVPIPGGMTPRHLFDTLQELARRAKDADASRSLPRIVGFDVVEISPPADVNRITARAGMGIIVNMLGLIAAQKRSARDLLQEDP